MARSQDLKKFRETNFISYMENQGMSFDSEISKSETVKLCSSDDFKDVSEKFEDRYVYDKAPMMIGHVGGFYVTASLAALAETICSSKPYLLFFDRKMANVENAILNTLLMKASISKEEYIVKLFNLSMTDVVKALKPSLYNNLVERILESYDEFKKLSKREKKESFEMFYHQRASEVDAKVDAYFVEDPEVYKILIDEFNLDKIRKYAENKPYHSFEHANLLLEHVKNKLDKKEYEVFLKLTKHITNYLGRDENFKSLLRYLPEDIKKNGSRHILANDELFEGYKNLFAGRGSYVKFVSGIDISTQKGVKKLEEILRRDGFISDSLKGNEFAINLAFIPHINLVTEAYPFLKRYVQDYITLNRTTPRNKSYFVANSTAILDLRTLKSIGAGFIEEERRNRQELTHLSEIEPLNGYPLLAFMGGANFGNIYHSEVDTYNMIDMAIANKVDTITIQGLIYATYYRNQTSRRLLTDPTYETIGSRLQAAKKVVEKLNNAGIKVIYQMGDEERQLYQDIFKIYTREQGVIGNNFLAREDLDKRFDWVRPIIFQGLIPYMIRSGEDVANLYAEDETKTNVSKVLHEIKRYQDYKSNSYDIPLGTLVQLKPEYLEDSDMFKVISSSLENYDKNDSSITVNLIASSGKTNKGKTSAYKNLRLYQSTIFDRTKKTGIPEIIVDAKQPVVSVTKIGDGIIVNTGSMIKDEWYSNPDLLPSTKEQAIEDPTYKRANQNSAKLNYPGGLMVTGDIRERMLIIPYYRRSRENMEKVQKLGRGYKKKAVAYINDWHIGSLAERPVYDVKFLDYFMYDCNPTGIVFNGDCQTGSNYGKYPNEARHVGANSMTQQMVSLTKLVKPYLQTGLGVVDGLSLPDKIVYHLANAGLLEINQGENKNVTRIKRGIDYKNVDLKLPDDLRAYEPQIRDVLSKIINLEFIDMLEGNHERNSDWNFKGYSEIELLRQGLEQLKEMTGSDIDLTLTEFFINSEGDFVESPFVYRRINDYNTIAAHCFTKSGSSPANGIGNWLGRMAPNLPRVDQVNSAHFHMFESKVVDNTLVTTTGSGSGQSGFEQEQGLSSQPLYVIQRYLEDGRVVTETVGPKFLDQYQIQNPYVKARGLDNFIQDCMTEEATIFARKTPEQIHKIYQRKLVPRKPNKEIGGLDEK